MKGTKAVSKASQDIDFKDRTTWIKLYYSITKDTVYRQEGEGRYFVCNLINPNTETDIVEAVEMWKRL